MTKTKLSAKKLPKERVVEQWRMTALSNNFASININHRRRRIFNQWRKRKLDFGFRRWPLFFSRRNNRASHHQRRQRYCEQGIKFNVRDFHFLSQRHIRPSQFTIPIKKKAATKAALKIPNIETNNLF